MGDALAKTKDKRKQRIKHYENFAVGRVIYVSKCTDPSSIYMASMIGFFVLMYSKKLER